MNWPKQLFAKASGTISKPSQNLATYIYVAMAISVAIGAGYIGSRLVSRVIAEVTCPLPAAPSVINTQIIVTPDNVDGVVNCASLDLIIGSTGEVIFQRRVVDDNDLNGDWGVTLWVNNLNIQSGGKLHANGTGYQTAEAESPGGDGGNGLGTSGGSGGGYGGAGGEGIPDGINPAPIPGATYGNQENPIRLGSAGGNSGEGGLGGNGGGAIRIESTGTLTLNGSIEANGGDGAAGGQSSGGGGSGGSILIEANSFAGNGTVSARGGSAANATNQGGGGGGGRILMLCDTVNNFTGTSSVAGGVTSNSQDGGTGTIIGPTCRPDEPTILKQFRSNLTTEIPVNGITTENTIVFAGNMSDVDAAEGLALQIELLPIGSPFTGIPTHTQPTNFPNPQPCSSAPTNCGRITATGITRSVEYHWQARVRDSKGGFSEWVSFGGNNESERDVLVTGLATTISTVSGNAQSATVFTQLANPVVVRITDTAGFPVPGYTVTWQVTNAANGGSFATGTSVTNNDGEASNTYTVGKTAGSNNNQFRAVATGLSGTPRNFTASGEPGPLDRFTVAASSVALLNTNFDPVTITAFDEYSNIKTNYTGTPSLTAVSPNNSNIVMGGNLTPNSITFTGGNAGVVIVNNVQYNTAESIKLKVTDGSAVGVSNAIAVVTSLGTCPDADGIIDSNQTWVSNTTNVGIFDCRGLDLNISNNAVLTLDNYVSGSTFYGATILADNISVATGSSIRANQQGFGQNSGPGGGTQGNPAGGGGHGGYGGENSRGGSPYGDLTQPVNAGSGGGIGVGSFSNAGGAAGGGAIKLEVTGSLLLDGTIEANGGNGSVSAHGGQSGGGAGGSIWIIADQLSKSVSSTPSISAFGGNGGNSGGGGAGGRIAIYVATTDNLTASTTVNAYGGTGSIAGAGTYYYEGPTQLPSQGRVVVNNVDRNGRRAAISGLNQEYTFENIHLTRQGDLELTDAGSTVNLTTTSGLTGDGTAQLATYGTVNAPSLTAITGAGVYIEQNGVLITDSAVTVTNGLITLRGTWQNIDDISLAADADMTFYPDATMAVSRAFTFGNFSVSSSSIVTFLGNTAANGGPILNVDNFTLAAGGIVTADTRGYGQNSGSGPGVQGNPAGGGGHGGYGGQTARGGAPYGDLRQPLLLGSGGGIGVGSFSNASGATGGGAIKITVADTATIDGTITANGGNGSVSDHGGQSGGGAGGSIWLEAHTLTKTGGTSPIIRALGGNGGSSGGGGAGGRIAIYAENSDTFTTDSLTSILMYGGTGSIAGAGTYYYEGPSQTAGQGLLKADNANRNGRRAAISGINQIYTFENIHLTRRGDLELTNPGSTVNLTSSAGLTGDGTAQLSTFGTINGPTLTSISDAGVFIEQGGNLITDNNVTVTNSLITIRGTWQNAVDLTFAADGDLTLYSDSTMAPLGEYTFGDVSASSTSVFTFLSNTAGNRGIKMNTNSFSLASGGQVIANAMGFGQNAGAGAGIQGNPAGGGSFGGYGGRSTLGPFGDLTQPTELGSGGGLGASCLSNASGGTGGGAIKITAATTMTIDGTISTNGTDGFRSAHGCESGGGSGGSIWLSAQDLLKTGGTSPVIRANGGGANSGGSGSGGRIAIYASNSDTLTTDSLTQIQAFTGSTGSAGGAGTIYYEGPTQTPGQGIVRADNNNRNGLSAAISGVAQTYTFENIHLTRFGDLELTDPSSTVNLTSTAGLTGDGTAQLVTFGLISGPSINAITDAGIFIEDGGLLLTGSNVVVTNALVTVRGSWLNIVDLTLAAGGDLTLYPDADSATNGVFSFGDLSASSTSIITLLGNTSNNSGVTLFTDNFSLAAGGVVTADQRGYGQTAGTGGGSSGINPASGGSFGGYGGRATSAPYGDLTQPSELGSGGGYANVCLSYASGGTAGGAIKVVSTSTMTINGTLTANGGDGFRSAHGCESGGGSGGSIWLIAQDLTKSGASSPIIRANGGGANSGGSGSGGRIAIYASNSDDFTTSSNTSIQARTGSTGSAGGAGTFYYEGPSQTVGQGILYVDNNNRDGLRAGISGAATTYDFERIQLTRLGDVELTESDSVVNISNSNGLTGDGTAQLATFGVVNAPALSNIADAGVFIEQDGVLATAADMTLSNGLITIRGTWENIVNLTLGAGGDLTFYPDATSAVDGAFTFGNLSASSTSIITLLGDTANDRGVTLNVADFTLASGGLVTADSRGHGQNSGSGGGQGGINPAGGGSYGGYGGGVTAGPYGDFRTPTQLGSGGGYANVCLSYASGGTGGGAIVINASGTATIDGTITSNGGAGGSSAHGCRGGGASGGSIMISADTLTKTPGSTPIIRANGAIAGNSAVGSGSGGRIALYAENLDELTIDSNTTLQAFGASGSNGGGPGTIYIENENNTDGQGSLIIDANNNSGARYADDFHAIDYYLHNLTIDDYVKVRLTGDTATNRGPVFYLNGDLRIGSSAYIDGVGQGFPAQQGPGAGDNGTGNSGGAGGGHGGDGGNGEPDAAVTPNGGDSYGSQRQPMTLGSGGGNAGPGASGGAGGGAIGVVTREGHVQIDGTIDVSGTNGLIASPGGGGGAGGSILIEASTCDIPGDLLAEGGDGGDEAFDGGGGGGGRISILYTTGPCTTTGTGSVAQGNSSNGQNGQVGTFPAAITLPSVPSTRDQFKSDAVTSIPVGGVTQEQQVVLKVSLFDPGATGIDPRTLRAEVEVVEQGDSFSSPVLGVGVTAGTDVVFTGGAPVVSEVTVTGLIPGVSYKWQARAVNVDDGISSSWVQFGGNSVSAADFVISTTESLDIQVSNTSVEVGDLLSLTVTALDGTLTQDTTYTGTVSFSSTSGTATLPANYIFGGGDAGQHEFTDQLVFAEAGAFTVTVVDTLNGTLTATTPVITVTEPASGGTTPPPPPSSGGTVVTNPDICANNPTLLACQADVIISNVTYESGETTIRVCWDTNIPTVGFIGYGRINDEGEAVYTTTTDPTNSYANHSCITLEDLDEQTAYAIRIRATSNAGKFDTEEGAAATLGGEVPPEVVVTECISIPENEYAFNSEHEAIVTYSTGGNANSCTLFYGNAGESLSSQSQSTNTGTNHSGVIDLSRLNGTSDIVYRIGCSVEVDQQATQCTAHGIIPLHDYLPYYPTPAEQAATALSELIIPGLLTLTTIVTAALNLFAFPRFFIFGIFWLRNFGKKKGNPWGLVYDADTKQPIAFATIRMFQNGNPVAQRVTDLEGRFGVPVAKGRYVVEVSHSEFKSIKDEVMIEREEQYFSRDFALDKEKEQKQSTITRQRLREVLSKLNTVIVTVGFIFSLIAAALSPVAYNIAVVGLYLVQFLLVWLITLRNRRNWGVVVSSGSKIPISGAIVRLFTDDQEKEQVNVQITNDNGQFGFLNKQGRYEIWGTASGYKGRDAEHNATIVHVEVKRGETIDQTLELDKQPGIRTKSGGTTSNPFS